MTRICTVLGALFLTTNVWATISSVYAISGVSGSTLNGGTSTTGTTPTTGTNLTIYGSLALNTTQAQCPSNGGTCNNCSMINAAAGSSSGLCVLSDTSSTSSSGTSTGTSQSPLCACQGSAIYNNLNAVIGIVDSANSGSGTSSTSCPSPYVYAALGSQSPGTGAIGTSNNVSNVTQTGEVSVPWSQLCSQMSTVAGGSGTTSDCGSVTSGASMTLTVWVDDNCNGIFDNGDDYVAVTAKIVVPSNSPSENVYGTAATDGLGQFTAFPGDGRIYLTDLDTASGNGFPVMNDTVNATAITVYASTLSLDDANASGSAVSTFSVGVNSDGSLAQNYVDGVTNGTRYWVRVATVDAANNIQQFYPDLSRNLSQTLQTACGSGNASNNYQGCPYTVVPDQVLGLLNKDFNCFIATAAYGSSMEPKLKVFRDFRFQYLLRNDWGLKFIYAYYHYGPIAARFIADKPWLRTLTRGFLWPLYWFSWSSLRFGLGKSLALSLILLAVLLGVPWYGVRRWRARA